MAEIMLAIPINLPDKVVMLEIFGESFGETLIEKLDAAENGEASFQIKEGCYYEYKITSGYCLNNSEVISQSKVNASSGRISPNIYVGTLTIDVLDLDQKKLGEVKLEVQSVKTNYREDYRFMLEEITEKCLDLLLQHSSPVSQYFEVNFYADANTLYQRFAFIKSILDTVEFNDAVHKIISAPVTRWKENEVVKDIRSVKRLNNSTIRQISNAPNRVSIPFNQSHGNILQSIPSKIKVNNKTETVDTSENRFVKHSLAAFESFCNDFKTKLNASSRIKNEVALLAYKLEQFLGHSIFKEISNPTTLPLNSPILQRKEGYREILRVWLLFDLAAKMVWRGGDDVYSGNKRDVAVLYEYWLFFKLLDILKEIFRINPLEIENLIEKTNDGLGLKLKQGQYLPIKGLYDSGNRKLCVEFSYNKTFVGNSEYPNSGSWTRSLRPDYTLSVWPFGIEADQAEKDELIVHIHFDAKYKVEDLQTIFGKENLDLEKEDQKKGTYKRGDLLKMHTYKDAIRRTAGAYILYPGEGENYTKKGFHEIIPGLGAFAIRPSKVNDGSENLKRFIIEVVTHFMNRASQREKISFKTYDIFKEKNSNELYEALPETYGQNRDLIPDETFVLIAYYRKENWGWIIKSGLYNARADSNRGSLRLGPQEAGAKYLLLHSENETTTGKILKITETGPRVFSKQTLIAKGYPSFPSQEYYLVYKVEEVKDKEFLNQHWDISQLEAYRRGRGSGLPFSVSLTELMKAISKKSIDF